MTRFGTVLSRPQKNRKEGSLMKNGREPVAVYKFGKATVRIYGSCSNIRAATEDFLKEVVRKRAAANKAKEDAQESA